jgi:imidazolonepropionase-like amidohydrolase
LLIEGTKITAVGVDLAIPEGVIVREHAGDVAPGWIALHDQSGGDGELIDTARVVLPEARVRAAFDPAHSDFAALVAEGITSIVLASPAEALVPGQTTVVKTAGMVVLRDPAHLQLTFSEGGLEFGRFPTSYGGAVAELDARMTAGQGSFGQARRGELPVLLAATEKHEILRALEFATRYELKGALIGAPKAGELLQRVQASGLAIVWQSYDVGLAKRDLDALAALAAGGVPFGFALGAPERHPASLRLGAAAALRAGVARDVAMRALSSTAASIAGVSDRVGRIAAGLDADVVLWSGDPLELTSSVQAVYIDGGVVHGGQ